MKYYANFLTATRLCLFECLTDTNKNKLIQRIKNKAEQATEKYSYKWTIWDDNGNIVAEGNKQ